jgi:transcriptional regulator with XRE-family HTH domain
MHIADKIYQFLDKKGISFSDFAAHIQVPESDLKDAFSNNSLEIRTLEKISKELKIPLYRFFRDPIGDLTDIQAGFTYASITEAELNYLKHQLEIANKEINLLKQELENREETIKSLLASKTSS